MEKRSFLREFASWLRDPRWTKEVLLAVVLTIAAFVFIATAILGRDAQDKAPFETARPQ